jgi:hypothetical protein
MKGPDPVLQHGWQVSRATLHNVYQPAFENAAFRVYVLNAELRASDGSPAPVK